MGHVLRGVLTTVLLSTALIGCAVNEDVDLEHVSLEYSDVELGTDGSWLGIDDHVIPEPCRCGDDYSCLKDWAEYNFTCGVCVSVACGDVNQNVCTSLCRTGPSTIPDQDIRLEQ